MEGGRVRVEAFYAEARIDEEERSGCAIYKDGQFLGFMVDPEDARQFVVWHSTEKAKASGVFLAPRQETFAWGVLVGTAVAAAVALASVWL